MNKDTNKRSVLYYEALRIFACFWVIFNHTGEKGFFLFSERAVGSVPFWVYLIISIFCKFSVPVFFAISGALLIKKTDSIQSLAKRGFRIFVSLVVFSAIYYIYDSYKGRYHFSMKEYLSLIYQGKLMVQFWYLYAYLAFLISLPLIRTLAQTMSIKQFKYLFGIAIVFNGIIPVLQCILTHNTITLSKDFNLSWLTSNIVLFPLMGYYISEKLRKVTNRELMLLWLINIISIFISAYCVFLTAVDTEKFVQNYHNSFVIINAFCIMVTFKYIFEKMDQKIPNILRKWIRVVGESTFGIYLWHVMFLNKVWIIRHQWDVLRINYHINYMVIALIMCMFVMIVCFLVTYIMKWIPFLRKIV